jgi:hypothetical protein
MGSVISMTTTAVPRTHNKLRLPEAPCQRSDAVSIRLWYTAKLRVTSVQEIVVH